MIPIDDKMEIYELIRGIDRRLKDLEKSSFSEALKKLDESNRLAALNNSPFFGGVEEDCGCAGKKAVTPPSPPTQRHQSPARVLSEKIDQRERIKTLITQLCITLGVEDLLAKAQKE